MVCCYQVTKLFLLEVLDYQCVLQRALVIEVLLHSSQFRSFGTWVNTLCFPDKLSIVPDEVVHEKCLPVHRSMLKLLRPRNFQCIPPTIPADHATGFPVRHRYLYSYFRFRFRWLRATGLPVLGCVYFDFVWLLDLAQNHPPLSPAMPMLRMYS